jgi:hypothetical protein
VQHRPSPGWHALESLLRFAGKQRADLEESTYKIPSPQDNCSRPERC